MARGFRRLPRPAQVIAALAPVWRGHRRPDRGAFVVGGSDSYGYVSQAHLWTIGAAATAARASPARSPGLPLDVLSPLGYRPSADGTTIAPTYSPGLPMVMAIFERCSDRDSVFWVVPLLGGVLVWATYLLGVRVHGPALGALAAVLVATSPPVLFQLTAAPMSDLPAAAWWTLALVLASLDRRDAAFGAGVVRWPGDPDASQPGAAGRDRRRPADLAADRGTSSRRACDPATDAVCGCRALAACLTIAAVNRALWGSALDVRLRIARDVAVQCREHLAQPLLYPRVFVDADAGGAGVPVARDRATETTRERIAGRSDRR